MPETVNLLAGTSSSGRPVLENVLVERRGPGVYRLQRSPGLTVGLAADDVIRVQADGRFDIVERGRNLCIWIYMKSRREEVEREATSRLGALGGRLDGKKDTLLVLTVSVDAGFEAVEAALTEVANRFPDVEWYYGNVYDPKDGTTPLDWWKPARGS